MDVVSDVASERTLAPGQAQPTLPDDEELAEIGRGAADPVLWLALLTVGLVGWVDMLTGPDWGFSLFYLVPVIAVAYRSQGLPVIAVAVAAGVSWGISDALCRSTVHWPNAIWNTGTRLAIYVGVGLLVARVRAQRRALQSANLRLEAALHLERVVARTDPLTGLLNWNGFAEVLRREVARCQRSGAPFNLVYVDLDNFKRVNDRFGHSTGDALLREVARALSDSLRASDVSARLGGDEFTLVLADVDAQQALLVGERIVTCIAALADAYPGTGLGASVGIAHFGAPTSDMEELVRKADDAMYEAKRGGKGRASLVVISD